MGPLVTTDWLVAELGKPDLVVFDATKYLPNEDKDGHAEFLRAHIAGARYFDIDVVADPDTDLPHMVPTPGRFAKLVGAMGVSNDSRVVFYDQKGLASAARGWWLMGLFGHDQAAVRLQHPRCFLNKFCFVLGVAEALLRPNNVKSIC